MSDPKAEKIIEELIPQIGADLPNKEEIGDLISETNAYGWGFDTFESLKASFSGYGKIRFTVDIELSGEHDQEKPYSGSSISAEVKGEAHNKNGSWQIEQYSILEAHLDTDETGEH